MFLQHVLKMLKVSGLGSKDVRACCGRFSFVANSRPLTTSSFGTCSGTGPDDRTYSRIQYDDYGEAELADARHTHVVSRDVKECYSMDNESLYTTSNEHTKERLLHTNTRTLSPWYTIANLDRERGIKAKGQENALSPPEYPCTDTPWDNLVLPTNYLRPLDKKINKLQQFSLHPYYSSSWDGTSCSTSHFWYEW